MISCQLASELARKWSKAVVLHHWDCDGIASAALIHLFREERGLETAYLVPPIEVYDSAVYRDMGLSESSNLIVVDYAVYPEFRSIVFDHHRKEVSALECGEAIVCNPAVLSERGELEYPATTVVLLRYLGIGRRDLVALGIVGDLGSKLDETEWREFVEEGAREAGLSLSEFKDAADILNSCYVLMDESIVERARKVLVEKGVEGILSDPQLSRIRDDIKKELDRIVSSAKPILETDGVVVFKVVSRYALVSKVGRILADRNSDKIVVIVGIVGEGKIKRVYARSKSVKLGAFINELRERIGGNVGGKDWVLSIVCRSDDCSYELNELLDVLKVKVR